MNTNPDSWDLINFFVIDWATKDKFLSVFFLHWDLISKAAVAKNLWGPSEIVNSSRARCLDVIVSKQICHFSLVCYASRLCKSFWANFLQYLTVWFCGQHGWESSEPKLSAPSPWQWTKSLLGHWVHISQHIRLDLVLSLSLLWWYEGTFYHQACGTNVSTISLLKVQRRISKQYIYIYFFFLCPGMLNGLRVLEEQLFKSSVWYLEPLENGKELPFAPWISSVRYLWGKKLVHKLGQISSGVLPS